MPRYENTDIAFDYPRDWEDRSFVSFAAPTRPNTTTTNVVMTRDKLGEDEDLKRYADRQLVEMAKRLDAFQLLEKRDIEIDGATAVDIKFSWRGSAGPLVQRLTVLPGKERQVMNLTCTTGKKDASDMVPVFDRIVSSIKLGSK